MSEGWTDVLPGLSVSENPSSRVLHILEPVWGFAGNLKQNFITVQEEDIIARRRVAYI